MKINIDMKGLDMAIKATQKAQTRLPKVVDKYEEDVIEVGIDYMERNVPYDTGELAESIKKKVEGKEKVIEVGADHAIPVEFGTYKQSAQPFVRPARKKMEEYAERKAGGVVDDAYK